jgi:mono/diheme cytochrome c family protein
LKRGFSYLVLLFAIIGWFEFNADQSCADDEANATANKSSFTTTVTPFLQEHCVTCHGGDEPEGGLALDSYRESARIQTDYETWEKILKFVRERQMPPKDEPQPDPSSLQEFRQAVQSELEKFDCSSHKHAGRVTIRRLNRTEYNNTIRDLIGIDFRPADDFPSDDVGNGFDNMGEVLSLPPLLLEKYLAAAETIVNRAMQDETARDRLVVHQPTAELTRREATRRNLKIFATRAFRRTISDAEVDRLLQLAKFAIDQGASPNEAFQTALQAVLVSPHFLFRIEADPQPGQGVRQLGDFELASRLSYFLWSSMPDRELFQLAKAGRLHDPKTLGDQVKRMLQDPKAIALTENFAGQWLQLRSLTEIVPDARQYPTFDDELRSAMRRETELFFAAVVREDRSILEFLNADFSYVNARLADHYGMSGVEGEQFRRVKLDDRRRGVLTQASILLITSNPTRTSPVKRGKWILDNILGEPPPPPPEGVAELDDSPDALGSMRERLEQHRSNEACSICHRKMDALGFGLENFDVIGAWRDRDGRFEIDAKGSLPGNLQFEGPKQLMQILAEQKSESFCRCLGKKMLTYALGRGLESFDRCTVDDIMKQLVKHDYRFSALVRAIVLSEPFRFRESLGEK